MGTMRVILLLLAVSLAHTARASEVKELTPVAAHMSGKFSSKYPASNCIDGNYTGLECIIRQDIAPWLAIELSGKFFVHSVVINTDWETLVYWRM